MSAAASQVNPLLDKFKSILRLYKVTIGYESGNQFVIHYKPSSDPFGVQADQIKNAECLLCSVGNMRQDGLIIPPEAVVKSVNGCSLDSHYSIIFTVDLSKLQLIPSSNSEPEDEPGSLLHAQSAHLFFSSVSNAVSTDDDDEPGSQPGKANKSACT